MAIFISYSHQDRDFVNKLAANLVLKNANVWVDTWELKIGDSLIHRVQEAIETSDALLVVLSKASVESEWCKKELNAGLVRELDEKKVLILPVLVEDCAIPLFLREKLYADFRNDFDPALNGLVHSLNALSTPNQGRQDESDTTTDWGIDWGYRDDGSFFVGLVYVSMSKTIPMSFLTQVRVICNEVSTARFKQFQAEGLDEFGRHNIVELVLEQITAKSDLRVILEDTKPQKYVIKMSDPKNGGGYLITITSRKMGTDNGKDQLLNVAEYVRQTSEAMKNALRRPPYQVMEKLLKVTRSPWPKG